MTIPRFLGDPRPLRFEGRLITSMSLLIATHEAPYETHAALWDAGDNWRVFIEKFTFEGRIRHPHDYCVTRFRSSGHLRTDLLLQDCRFDVLAELLLNAAEEVVG